MPETKTGYIKFYNSEKGYGFIKADDGQDFFYHVSDLKEENYRPQADERVKFSVITGKRGLKATYVQQC